jgi:acyl-CoA dehydrogenase
MAWDFSTDPEVQEKLDWADRFIAEEIEPLEHLLSRVVNIRKPDGPMAQVIAQWRQEVKDHDLYAAHLSPEQGGQGYGELQLALLNEILGRSAWAQQVFATGPGTPGSGQSDVLAVYANEEQKEKWLKPLLEDKIYMVYSMSEPHGGADPSRFATHAVLDGNEWVINGDKLFTTNAHRADLIMLVAVTEPDAPTYERYSMFIVPTDTPGVKIVNTVGPVHVHDYIRYDNVRVPFENQIGPRGGAFGMAQRRLGAGRLHHSMRAVARCKKNFDMICERALSRYTQGSLLAEMQMVQEMIADSWMELTQFRLLILQTAWTIDNVGFAAARKYVAACKVQAAQLQREMAFRAIHIHGALGTTSSLPMDHETDWLGIADGPTEVHKVTVARQVLRDYQPSPDLWPSEFMPRTYLNARKRYDEVADRRLPDKTERAALDELLATSPTGNDEAIAEMQAFMDMTTKEGTYADYEPRDFSWRG